MIKQAFIINLSSGNPEIKLTFAPIPANLEFVKSFDNYTYNKLKKYWKIPISIKNSDRLRNNGYVISPKLSQWVSSEKNRMLELKSNFIIEGLKGVLRKYQKTGVSFYEKRNGRALNADEPGLGKTIQTVAWLQYRLDMRPVVIICPTSVKFNWAIEIHEWMTRANVEILSGIKPWKITGQIVIINPALLQHWADELRLFAPKVIIVDEIHKFSDESTIQYQALEYISWKAVSRIGLSGTPIQNYPIELLPIWKWIDKSSAPNRNYYIHTFCDAKKTRWGLDVKGASNLDQLNDLLTNSIMIRRLKSEVLTELPPKTYCLIPIEIDNKAEYTRAYSDFSEYHLEKVLNELDEINSSIAKLVSKSKNKDFKALNLFDALISEDDREDLIEFTLDKLERASGLMKLAALRQIATQGIMNGVFEWIDNFLRSGKKLILFCEHRFVIDQIIAKYKSKAVCIHGGVSPTKRQTIKEQFQKNSKIKIFIGNSAAQEGLTLTAASNVAHIEIPWNATSIDQRNDRAHRITQVNAVTCWYFIPKNTIIEKIAELVDLKRITMNSVIDNKKTNEQELIKSLIKQIKTKHNEKIRS